MTGGREQRLQPVQEQMLRDYIDSERELVILRARLAAADELRPRVEQRHVDWRDVPGIDHGRQRLERSAHAVEVGEVQRDARGREASGVGPEDRAIERRGIPGQEHEHRASRMRDQSIEHRGTDPAGRARKKHGRGSRRHVSLCHRATISDVMI